MRLAEFVYRQIERISDSFSACNCRLLVDAHGLRALLHRLPLLLSDDRVYLLKTILLQLLALHGQLLGATLVTHICQGAAAGLHE